MHCSHLVYMTKLGSKIMSFPSNALQINQLESHHQSIPNTQAFIFRSNAAASDYSLLKCPLHHEDAKF